MFLDVYELPLSCSKAAVENLDVNSFKRDSIQTAVDSVHLLTESSCSVKRKSEENSSGKLF
jgi:hypothetical protein